MGPAERVGGTVVAPATRFMQHPSPESSTPRIVAIEPHPLVRQGLATLLADTGYDLVVHPRAAGALSVIRQVQPVVALIELHLEVPSAGLEVVRALRADPATRELPLIVWSSDLDVERHVAALNVPAVTVVSKYDAAATVRTAIDGAAARARSTRGGRSERDPAAAT